MNRLLSLSLVSLVFATPAAAQSMGNMAMPGMSMPMPGKAAAKPAKAGPAHKKTRPARKTRTRHAHAAAPAMAHMPGMGAKRQPPGDHDMSSMPGMKMPPAGSGAMKDMPGMSASPPASPSAPGASPADMAGMKGMAMPGAAAGTAAAPAMSEPEIPAGPPPPPPRDHAADRFFDPAAMAAARATLRQEHGGMSLSQVMANLFEYQARARGGDGYRWDGQAWFGGDIDRFVLKSEGEGGRRGGLGSAEVQALYSHAIGPYFNVEGGVRQDFSPRARTYATLGVEGLAPYWVDVTGALFLSTQGEVLGRAEATYDLRLSQRLILQPRVELNLQPRTPGRPAPDPVFRTLSLACGCATR